MTRTDTGSNRGKTRVNVKITDATTGQTVSAETSNPHAEAFKDWIARKIVWAVSHGNAVYVVNVKDEEKT